MKSKTGNASVVLTIVTLSIVIPAFVYLLVKGTVVPDKTVHEITPVITTVTLTPTPSVKDGWSKYNTEEWIYEDFGDKKITFTVPKPWFCNGCADGIYFFKDESRALYDQELVGASTLGSTGGNGNVHTTIHDWLLVKARIKNNFWPTDKFSKFEVGIPATLNDFNKLVNLDVGNTTEILLSTSPVNKTYTFTRKEDITVSGIKVKIFQSNFSTYSESEGLEQVAIFENGNYQYYLALNYLNKDLEKTFRQIVNSIKIN